MSRWKTFEDELPAIGEDVLVCDKDERLWIGKRLKWGSEWRMHYETDSYDPNDIQDPMYWRKTGDLMEKLAKHIFNKQVADSVPANTYEENSIQEIILSRKDIECVLDECIYVIEAFDRGCDYADYQNDIFSVLVELYKLRNCEERLNELSMEIKNEKC
jgi:hypothetical protein